MGFNLEQTIEKLYNAELPTYTIIQHLCTLAKEQLVNESNIIHLQSPINIVGDIHGQFNDLIELFKIGNKPPDSNYLFLGDYVDRGYFSLETILLLLGLKTKFTKRVYLLRGNHECRNITKNYGFYQECLHKYSPDNVGELVWRCITDVFDYLVLGAIIDNTILCVHGGLSPMLKNIDDIKHIDRFQEIPHDGAMADLVWSDPSQEIDDNEMFAISPRGAGYTFGKKVVEEFVSTNNMDCIVRAHQLCMQGYQILFDYKLITVWSAPNYCYRCGNLASILEVYDKGFMENHYFNVFEAAPQNERIVFSKDEQLEYFL